MGIKTKDIYMLMVFVSMLSAACAPKEAKDEAETQAVAVTPVQITNPSNSGMADYIELNATSSFLRKETIKSNANGYVTDIRISIGQEVGKGDTLFILKTKEARALDHFETGSDIKLNFSGKIPVLSTKNGIVSAIMHQKGDYVQDGDQLATLSDRGSLVFLIDAPFEYHKYMAKGKNCMILLPDGESLPAQIQSDLPTMDVTNQTQNYVIRATGVTNLPEGLIARVRIETDKKSDAITLPKDAVLSNETEDNFWVMKLINDSTAVKIPVKIGLQNDDKKEILSPELLPSDRIVTGGNYGLADTARIKIQK